MGGSVIKSFGKSLRGSLSAVIGTGGGETAYVCLPSLRGHSHWNKADKQERQRELKISPIVSIGALAKRWQCNHSALLTPLTHSSR